MNQAKEFAQNGYYVFPLIGVRDQVFRPFGWSGGAVRDETKQSKIISASNNPEDVDSWPDQAMEKYGGTVKAFGVLGRGCVIIDLDVKDGHQGLESFNLLRTQFDIPLAELVVKTKSGGMHLYYARPEKFKDRKIKTLAGLKILGQFFDGLDIRGDGGFVVGPSSHDEWSAGNYTITKGSASSTLSELPESFLAHLTSAVNVIQNDVDNIIVKDDLEDPNDYRVKLKRGEIPDFVPMGARNDSFYIFINAIKSKGLSRDIAKQMAEQLATKCESPETLHESINIDDMISRVFEIDSNNPYDICSDLVNRGIFQLTNYNNSRIMYAMPFDNPYLTSKHPHNASSMKELLQRYTRTVVSPNGRDKQVNPMDLVISRIPDTHKVTSIAFKPGAGQVFSIGADRGAAKYLNTYKEPQISLEASGYDALIFEIEFKQLVASIFGPVGSDEYQLGLDFPAWLLQKPQLKMSIAPLLLSKVRGVGKSLYFNLLNIIMGSNLLGEPQGRVVKLDEMTGRFFDPTSVLLNMVDEVQFGLHKNLRQELSTFWRHLKNIVTAETYPVEIKGGPVMQLPNSAALILAGNSDGFVPMEEGDRRIWVIDNNAKILEKGVVDRLFDVVKSTGPCANSFERTRLIESLRHGLINHNIQIDLSTVRAPMNELKISLIRSGLTDSEDWLLRYFEDTDNVLAAHPIVSHSGLKFILQTSDLIMNESWRELFESLIRDYKRKGILRPIARGGSPRKLVNIPTVLVTGEVVMTAKFDILYCIDGLENFDELPDDEVRKLFFQNLQTIKRPKSRQTQALNPDNLINF